MHRQQDRLLECKGTANVGGTILLQGLYGQANNDQNCTGSITYTQTIIGHRGPRSESPVCDTGNGDMIKGLPVDPDQVLSCLLNRTSNSDGN